MNKLVLEMLADSNGLLKGLDQAQRSVDKFTSSASTAGAALGSGLNRALDAFAGLATGGVAAAGVLAGGFAAATVAAGLLAVSAGAQAEAIEMLAQKTGISTTTLQGWSVVMAENNLQGESLTTAMRTLSKQIIEARDPASKASAAFEEMGIAVDQLGTTDSTLRAVADRFKAMPDGVDKARMAVELFGKSGLELIPMLNRGAKAFDESRQAAISFGAVLSGEQLAALSRVDDAADRLSVAFGGLKNRMALLVAPGTEAAIKIITEAFAMLSRGLASVDTALDTLAIRFSHFALAVNTIAKQTFSLQVFNVDAWKQTLADIRQIDAEAAKLIEKRRQLESGGGGNGSSNDGHVAAFVLSQGEKQEALGRRILAQSIERYKLTLAEGHAQEALGKTQIAIIQRETAERNNAFALQAEQAEAINNLQFEKRDNTALDKQLVAVKQLMALMPELTAQEASLLAIHNQSAAHDTITKSLDAYQHRNDALDDAVEKYKALDQAQQALYATDIALSDKAGAARRVRFGLIEAEADRERQRINETMADESRKAQALLNLDARVDAQRRQAIQQFPTFFEQQMQSIVQSNAFSVGQIITTWTSGMATAFVDGGNFIQAAWRSTQVAIVQGALNTGVQLAAQAALNASVEMGILTAQEAAKLGLKTASNATIVAGEAATAGATVGIWGAAGTAILGIWGTITSAFSAMAATMVGVLTAVGTFVMGVLEAIASALTATVFGIPYAGAILLGVAAIAAALALTGNLGFKDGGIGDFGAGTPATLHGREAIIPLNKRGADFMREALGGQGGGSGIGSLTVPVMLDGREIARAVVNDLPHALRNAGLPAFG